MATDSTVTLRDLAAVLFKYRAMILVLVFGTVVLVGIVSYVRPDAWQARARIRVELDRRDVSPPDVIESPVRPTLINSTRREEDVASEVEVLTSRNLVEKTVMAMGPERLDPPLVRPDTLIGQIKYHVKVAYRAVRRWIDDTAVLLGLTEPTTHTQDVILAAARLLDVEQVRNSDVVEVRFTWPMPDLAAEFVNTLLEHYRAYYVSLHADSTVYAVLEKETRDAEQILNQAEDALMAAKADLGVASLDKQRSLLLDRQAELEASRQDNDRRIEEMRGRVAAFDRQLEGGVPRAGAGASRSPAGEGGLIGGETRLRLRGEILRVNAALEGALQQRRTLSEQAGDVRKRLETLDQQEMHLRRLERELKVRETTFLLYQSKLEELRVSQLMDQNQINAVTVIEPAQPPIRPERFISLFPRKVFNLLAALLGGLVAGLGLAFTLEYVDRGLDTRRKVETLTGLPVLASLPDLGDLGEPR